ncbi:DNA-binding XRE family transcriptional regulator [Archangium gephyra]|uniref:DNA-binding XRE family transcriptional regulator n=1 Tax=Archangium gephyra TaxID=48 RepID=A0ABX9K5Q9_9BACT|nr:helix-turn-helix transcriptional regulator [Archangium gephyra]REG33330.1 DNA-binding XRE family transcriptional regulator [Archangium gephyra]
MASKTTFQVPPEQTPPPLRPRRSKREAKLKLSKALGDAAREARQKASLTQADVAERIGVATEVYGRLERGLLMPSVPTLRRICLALHLSADALLALSSPQPPVWEEPPPPAEQEQPAMRRLLRNVRKLNSTQIRALSLVASTLRREGED